MQSVLREDETHLKLFPFFLETSGKSNLLVFADPGAFRFFRLLTSIMVHHTANTAKHAQAHP